ncbi:hypothetical protein BUALT_Bualt13G0001600 [Buddleja alternifolia]|uniref:BRCT domain-containing protein n=1 Tax=Buddleja alternifolia TaxID=168488 RepID=A0AAV6WUJ1_9LAMI|nr:hypothetical protein BUALT_Bualt13G0001600 [Buddleja alternifolia]
MVLKEAPFDMASYLKSVRSSIHQELKRIRKARRENSRNVWRPLLTPRGINGIVVSKPVNMMGRSQSNFAGFVQTGRESLKRFSTLVASQHMHLLVVLLFPARLLELANEDPSKNTTTTTFAAGVRFLLLGFDHPINKHKIRSKLFEGGGIDALNYDNHCTHVIVDRLVYDDPICVNARKDGKTLVTGLWVDHSYDVGMPVDPTSVSFSIYICCFPFRVMYRPMKDLNGIPGAKSLIVCLTGYQRQDRDDIMTMVGLMGANFSKPLVANKVTHLICYKFEGEKYELAKKMKKIKLVNHCWLEDCLKAWDILPEADYSKSGYELEMEAEAKDSEEETEDVAPEMNGGRKNIVIPQNTRAENRSFHLSPLKQEVSRNRSYLSASNSLANIANTSKVQTTPGKEIEFDKAPFLQETHNRHPEMSRSSGRSPGKISSEVSSSMLHDMMISEKVENVLASASKSAKKSPDADMTKLSGKSYSRGHPRNPNLSLSSGKIECKARDPSASNVDKFLVEGGFNVPLETHHDGTDFAVKTPLEGILSHLDEGQTDILPEKRKTTASGVRSESIKVNNDPEKLQESPVKVVEVSAYGSSVNGSGGLAGQVSPINDVRDLSEEASLAPKEALNIAENVVSEDRENYSGECSSEGLEKRTLSTNMDVQEYPLSRTDYSTGGDETHRSDRQSIESPYPKTNILPVETSNGHTDLKLSKVAHTGPQIKPLKRKLGPKPSICKGSTTKLKGSISLQKVSLQSENMIQSIGAGATEGTDDATITEMVVMVPQTNTDRSQKTPTKNHLGSEGEAIEEVRPVDDGRKAAEDKGANDFDRSSNKGKSGEVEAPNSGNIPPVKSLDVNNTENRADGEIITVKEKVAKPVEDVNGPESEKSVPSKKIELIESKSATDAGEKKLSKCKKRPLTKAKTNKLKVCRDEGEKNGSDTKQDEKTVEGNDGTVSLDGKTKTRPSKKLKTSTVAGKENKPATIKHQNMINNTGKAEKVAPQPVKKPLKNGLKADNANTESGKVEQNVEVKTEPAWFILSGHRLQRKEFQQVIKRLKGRVCRDSHHWSYQATHFIVPDPIRRTEKLFAAAASGSWILKTDYLSASNEAGRLLSEEPYEWHKKGLSEDGAINLEAPRKWRLVRERTGHGAFYGMRIIIYGECIAPPLDTLKRVVKAGDGTILATAPPYTRFFQSRIDFAIVSPGMPRVDMWVQEFVRHEIPCVVADYLVEYVCKPGYSLERHVLHNTQGWAEKSLKNLVNRVEEVDKDVRTPEDHRVINDVVCKVCGSCDGGEEMLICGDESGTVGCGVGTHIECLDPPLEQVPEEDWFCSECSNK